MSLRSTMDLGLAALTAPSESSGSAVGVLAAVGAAVAGLAAVTAVQKAVAEQIKTLPALGLSEQSMGDVIDLTRRRSSGELLPVGFQHTRDRAARRVVEAMARNGMLKHGTEAARATRARWNEILETPDGVAVLTDTLLDLGDPMGDALALTAGKQPFVNMGVEDEWSDPLNTELSPSDSIQDPMTDEEDPDGAIGWRDGWHETRCTLENPMKIGDRPGGSLGMEWYAPLSLKGNGPAVVPAGPEVAAMFDRYGYDGDQIVETYGDRRFRDFVDDDYDGYCRDHFCLYPNVSSASRFEVHVCSKGPLPKKGE